MQEGNPLKVETDPLAVLKQLVLQELHLELNRILQENGSLRPPLQEQRYNDYVALSHSGKIAIVQQSNIIYCKSDLKKTCFFLSNATSLLSSINLGEFEKNILNDRHFYRIHHSYLVNLGRIRTIIQKESQNFCEMDNGDLIPISKRKLSEFKKYLKL